jgi:hypothetical protein
LLKHTELVLGWTTHDDDVGSRHDIFSIFWDAIYFAN